MTKNKYIHIYTLLVYIFFSVWWAFLQFPSSYHDVLNKYFGGLYGIMALWGALWGIKISKTWGGLKSIMGKAIFMFAFGLLLQELGQIIYFYYIFFHNIQAPYPSLGDIGYFGSIPFYIYGVFLLAKASGVRIGLKSFKNKVQGIIVPLIILSVSYIFFLKDYSFEWGEPLTIFLDFGYPLGQAIYVSLALLTYILSRNILGGIMRKRILFILFALCVQYLADFTFLYQAHQGTWQAGGANDFLYLTSYFMMSLALIELRIEHIKSKIT